MTDTLPLSGLHALLTRPLHQAQGLNEKIKSLGGHAIIFPTLEIAPPQDRDALHDAMSHIDEFDIGIFVSANTLPQIIPYWPRHPRLSVLAIGSGTAKTLSANNIHVNQVPEKFNSEGLLALPILNEVQGKKIIIFCGENPRPLLHDTLSERGAKVADAICYRRVRPSIDLVTTMKTLRCTQIDIIVSTSKESLDNLYEMLGKLGREWLLSKPLLVISDKMGEYAQQLQFSQPLIHAGNASDEAIVAALAEWSQTQKV